MGPQPPSKQPSAPEPGLDRLAEAPLRARFPQSLPSGVVLLEGLPPDALTTLTPRERARHDSFPAPKRQRDWLMGRLAGKAAALRVLGAAAPLEILTDASGAPCLEGSPRPLALTLSHGHGYGAAWANAPGPEGGLPGLDLERVKFRPQGTLRFYLHPEERAWVESLTPGEKGSPGPRDRAAIVAWALKEAAFKALRPPRGTGLLDVGLELDPRAAAEAAEGVARIAYRGDAAERAAGLGVASVDAGWVFADGLVLAWVLARGGALAPSEAL